MNRVFVIRAAGTTRYMSIYNKDPARPRVRIEAQATSKSCATRFNSEEDALVVARRMTRTASNGEKFEVVSLLRSVPAGAARFKLVCKLEIVDTTKPNVPLSEHTSVLSTFGENPISWEGSQGLDCMQITISSVEALRKLFHTLQNGK